ncbi:hypothetical protein BDK51DRAFT_30052 [Blyttiomyces helicus]|uniref:Uncharacterized protein n=1 Tax=Blyttiomyces helicus TaxID=388810 RepID=A0A4P9WTJ9_9FUNG|nr:hypothetical protein BDK51DRAFT_30052 [Blyttiomyces helicus]|eukprot:RKO94396.1 hypothetical protein BDK51DRAFT_30052 [Blyttiomyces helicus]
MSVYSKIHCYPEAWSIPFHDISITKYQEHLDDIEVVNYLPPINVLKNSYLHLEIPIDLVSSLQKCLADTKLTEGKLAYYFQLPDDYHRPENYSPIEPFLFKKDDNGVFYWTNYDTVFKKVKTDASDYLPSNVNPFDAALPIKHREWHNFSLPRFNLVTAVEIFRERIKVANSEPAIPLVVTKKNVTVQINALNATTNLDFIISLINDALNSYDKYSFTDDHPILLNYLQSLEITVDAVLFNPAATENKVDRSGWFNKIFYNQYPQNYERIFWVRPTISLYIPTNHLKTFMPHITEIIQQNKLKVGFYGKDARGQIISDQNEYMFYTPLDMDNFIVFTDGSFTEDTYDNIDPLSYVYEDKQGYADMGNVFQRIGKKWKVLADSDSVYNDIKPSKEKYYLSLFAKTSDHDIHTLASLLEQAIQTLTNEYPSGEEPPRVAVNSGKHDNVIQTHTSVSPTDKEREKIADESISLFPTDQKIYASSNSSNKSIPGTLFYRFIPRTTKSSLAIQSKQQQQQLQQQETVGQTVTILQQGGPSSLPPPPPAGPQAFPQRVGPSPAVAQMAWPQQQTQKPKMHQVQYRKQSQIIDTYYQNPKTSENVMLDSFSSKVAERRKSSRKTRPSISKRKSSRRTSKKRTLSRPARSKPKKSSRRISEKKTSRQAKLVKINSIMLTGLFYTTSGELPLLQITVGVILGAIVMYGYAIYAKYITPPPIFEQASLPDLPPAQVVQRASDRVELGPTPQILKQRQSERTFIPRETHAVDNFEESVGNIAAHSIVRNQESDGDDEYDEQEDEQEDERNGDKDI